MKTVMKQLTITLGLIYSLVGCGGNSFTLGNDAAQFSQDANATSVPIDILWVVDNSGSMATSQQQVATNVSSFITKFQQTNFDFRIAVTTTDAYLSNPEFTGNASYSRFRDGTPATGYSGVKIITRDTPNIESVFDRNIKQGTSGAADERSFQSMEAALLNVENRAEFPRPGALLAVIFLTDEEDFSWSGTQNIQLDSNGVPNLITDPRLYPIQRYLDVLDTVTSSTATKKNYIVNTIAIFDQTCLTQLQTGFAGRRIAERHAQLTDATGGSKGSLCGDFSNIMSNLSDTLLEFSSKFYLDGIPNVATIQVFVNNALVPAEGWVYSAADNSITFKTGYIPAQGSKIAVKFQRTTLK